MRTHLGIPRWRTKLVWYCLLTAFFSHRSFSLLVYSSFFFRFYGFFKFAKERAGSRHLSPVFHQWFLLLLYLNVEARSECFHLTPEWTWHKKEKYQEKRKTRKKSRRKIELERKKNRAREKKNWAREKKIEREKKKSSTRKKNRAREKKKSNANFARHKLGSVKVQRFFVVSVPQRNQPLTKLFAQRANYSLVWLTEQSKIPHSKPDSIISYFNAPSLHAASSWRCQLKDGGENDTSGGLCCDGFKSWKASNTQRRIREGTGRSNSQSV